MSAVVQVLSAGAIEPGLVDAAAAFGDANDCEVKITWATTPVILRRVAGGIHQIDEAPDGVGTGLLLEQRIAGDRAQHLDIVGRPDLEAFA